MKRTIKQGNLDEKDRVYIDSERLHIHEKKDEYGNYSVAKLLIDKNKNLKEEFNFLNRWLDDSEDFKNYRKKANKNKGSRKV